MNKPFTNGPESLRLAAEAGMAYFGYHDRGAFSEEEIARRIDAAVAAHGRELEDRAAEVEAHYPPDSKR